MCPLHLDYRPQTFDEIIGNQEVVDRLKVHLKKDRPNHSLMFSGPFGCGKTTLARLIATVLGCPPELENGEYNMDYREIDAATDRGIDTAREIRERMGLRPLQCPVRVYVFDEAHGLTLEAKRAYLKALEDGCPDWVWMILCTTEPEKLDAGIRRRCSKFIVRKLDKTEMRQLIEWVVKEEDETVPDEAIKQIVSAAEGSPGEALNLLDGIIDLPKDKMKASIQQIETRKKKTIDLIKAIINNSSWAEVSKILKGLEGENEESIRRGIIGYASKVALDGSDFKGMLAIYEAFRDPFYNTGWAGLRFACMDCVYRREGDIPF